MVILVLLYQVVGGYTLDLEWFELDIPIDIVLIERYMIMDENIEKEYEGVRGRYAISSIGDCYL